MIKGAKQAPNQMSLQFKSVILAFSYIIFRLNISTLRMDQQEKMETLNMRQEIKDGVTDGKIGEIRSVMEEELPSNRVMDQAQVPIQSINSLISVDDSQHQSRNALIAQEVDLLVQIDIKKQSSQIQTDQILKIFNSLKTQPQKRPSKSSKPVPKKKGDVVRAPIKKVQFGHLSQKARLKVDKVFKHFRSMYKPSASSSQFQKVRYDGKQKLYVGLYYGIQQLRNLSQLELSQEQKRILKSSDSQQSNHIRKILTQVDKAFRVLNKVNQMTAGRQLKNQWSYVTSNIKDQKNKQLRRKILNGSFTPEAMSEAKQIDFYTSEKKEQIIKKQKIFLAEFEAQEKVNNPVVENLQAIDHRSFVSETIPIKSEQKQKQAPKNTNSQLRYFNETSIRKVKEMISPDHLSKMSRRLAQDLQGNIKQHLIKHLLA